MRPNLPDHRGSMIAAGDIFNTTRIALAVLYIVPDRGNEPDAEHQAE